MFSNIAFFQKIEWYPSIGDPTIIGWVTVAAYFFAASRSYRVAKYSIRAFSEPYLRQKNLWYCIFLLMIFLGINKQLDLQSFFTATARYMALEYDWYQYRRELQKTFIYSIILIGTLGILTLFTLYSKVIKIHAMAIFGVCALVSFVLVRAASFHYVDIFIGTAFYGIYMNWILELGGIALVSINAKKILRHVQMRKRLSQ